MVAGGGVLGKGNGTARGAIIPVGAIIGELHLFIEVYPRIGGITTWRIVGKGINGINKRCLTNRSKRIGEAGKRISIGRSKIVGVSRA